MCCTLLSIMGVSERDLEILGSSIGASGASPGRGLRVAISLAVLVVALGAAAPAC